MVKQDRPHAEKCGGKIIASVKTVDEPYFGGTSANLDVGYKCERCKEPLFGSVFPREEDRIAEILTAHVATLPQRKGRKDHQ